MVMARPVAVYITSITTTSLQRRPCTASFHGTRINAKASVPRRKRVLSQERGVRLITEHPGSGGTPTTTIGPDLAPALKSRYQFTSLHGFPGSRPPFPAKSLRQLRQEQGPWDALEPVSH